MARQTDVRSRVPRRHRAAARPAAAPAHPAAHDTPQLPFHAPFLAAFLRDRAQSSRGRMTEKVIISDLDSLRRWRNATRTALVPSLLPLVEFDLPALEGSANHQLSREAARLHRACGCASAGLAMTAAVMLSVASVALDPRGPAGLPLLSWGGYLLFIIATATAGKLAGLFWARKRMMRLAASVEALIDLGSDRQAR